MKPRRAAIRVAPQVEAIVSDVAVGLFLEPQKIARVVTPCSSDIKDFVIHANYASTKVIGERPDAVGAFCAGWFEAVDIMLRDKDQAVRNRWKSAVRPSTACAKRRSRSG
ncbi:MAG TPA: hypothetical protein VJR47_17905 [Stellaceae bacterium]|nr:hypothetical protein [Stellaceae bacterium]